MYKTIIVLTFNNKKQETIWKKCKRSHQLSFIVKHKDCYKYQPKAEIIAITKRKIAEM